MAKNKQGGVYERRANAKLRLEVQLKSGVKSITKARALMLGPGEDGKLPVALPLTESDIKRIETQIETLDKRMKSNEA